MLNPNIITKQEVKKGCKKHAVIYKVLITKSENDAVLTSPQNIGCTL